MHIDKFEKHRNNSPFQKSCFGKTRTMGLKQQRATRCALDSNPLRRKRWNAWLSFHASVDANKQNRELINWNNTPLLKTLHLLTQRREPHSSVSFVGREIGEQLNGGFSRRRVVLTTRCSAFCKQMRIFGENLQKDSSTNFRDWHTTTYLICLCL